MTVGLLPGTVHTRSEHVWGTVVTLDVRDPEATAAAVDAAWESVRAELHRIDAVFSTFRDDSVISRLRAGGTHVVADDVAEVVDRCLEVRMATDGSFDPWKAAGGFDPSGLVKGWAADRCAEIVRRHGFRTFSVDAAGDLACRGSIADAEGWAGWPIGIAHPDDPTAIVAVVDVRDGAIATSGTSQRGEHVHRPRLGRPRARSTPGHRGRARTAPWPTRSRPRSSSRVSTAHGGSPPCQDGPRTWWTATTATSWGPAFETSSIPEQGAKER